ncbi:hypothetical protein ACLOJK_004460, partial [Asimina triloba]
MDLAAHAPTKPRVGFTARSQSVPEVVGIPRCNGRMAKNSDVERETREEKGVVAPVMAWIGGGQNQR